MSELAAASRYLWFPVVAALASGVLAVAWSPSVTARSYVQHLAAGVVLAAVMVEVMPEILERGEAWSVGLGFAVGTALMLGLKWWVEGHERRTGTSTVGLVATAFVDTFVDGLTIGIAFAVAKEAGAALSLGLGVELFFLGLAVVSPTDGRVGVGAALRTTGGLAFVLAAGAVVGIVLLGGLPRQAQEGLLALGAAALLYLVLEELLVEAHEHADPVPAAGLLFTGILLFLVFIGF